MNRKKEQNSSLLIKQVAGRSDLQQFIRVPWSIYTDDPAWVPPLLIERKEHLSLKNPFFAHAHFCSWIACRGTRVVGRISAQVDDLHIWRYQDATGFFGMLEAEDNAETFQSLLNIAEDWLRSKGMRRIRGPFNLSVNQECGLLVEGFDTPPSIMMGHARPYYGSRIEAQGYHKRKDFLAYLVDTDFDFPPVVKKLFKKNRHDIVVRPLRKSRFSEEMEIIMSIFNDAWSQNWGFVPFTKTEFEHIGKDINLLVNEDLVQIAEVGGTPAAMIVVLPNINEVIKDLDGRLLPFGWLKLLWRLKITHPKSSRVPLMGVRRQYQGGFMGPALAFRVIDAVRAPAIKRGFTEVEMSWILEDNMGMRNIIESIGGIAYKRYRIYGKNLGKTGSNLDR
ncbi:MAG: N-acetyltransferase [Dissulfuribacterales bacterium]